MFRRSTVRRFVRRASWCLLLSGAALATWSILSGGSMELFVVFAACSWLGSIGLFAVEFSEDLR